MDSNTGLPPTHDERTLAMLAHLLQLFGGFIAPLVIYIVKRDSRFVAFHALQALIWQGVYFILSILGVGVWLLLFISTVAVHSTSGASKGPPVAVFIFFPLLWIFIVIGWVITLTLAIVYGIKANQGQWARYPIIGGWAYRLAPSEAASPNPN